jgi:hypothetical protein
MKKATSCEAALNPAAKIIKNTEFTSIQPPKNQCDTIILSTVVSKSIHKEHAFPIWGLPDAIQRIINEVSQTYQCSLDFPATAALCAIGSAVGTRACVRWKSYTNFPNAWTIMVGYSSDKKSQPTKWMMQPIIDINGKLVSEYKEALRQCKRDLNAERPTERRICTQDFTPEKLFTVLVENLNGVCLYRDEIKGMFKDINRYNNSGFVQQLLSIFDNGPIDIMRSTREPIFSSRSFLNIIGTIQPTELVSLIGNPEFMGNGLNQRFNFVYPEASNEPAFCNDSVVPSTIVDAWNIYIKQLYYEFPQREFQLSDDAVKKYREYYNRNEQMMFDHRDDPYLAAIYGKLRIQVLRYALLTAITHGDDEPITGEDMYYSIECMDYFEHTAQKVYDLIRKPEKPITKADAIRVIAGDDGKGIKNQSQFAESIGVTQPYISHILKK